MSTCLCLLSAGLKSCSTTLIQQQNLDTFLAASTPLQELVPSHGLRLCFTEWMEKATHIFLSSGTMVGDEIGVLGGVPSLEKTSVRR